MSLEYKYGYNKQEQKFLSRFKKIGLSLFAMGTIAIIATITTIAAKKQALCFAF